MNDRYDQDMILGYVEGDLDDAQREAFEATLSQDHELRNLVSQMKLDRENLRSLGGTPAPVGLIDQVMQTQERAELLGDPEVPEPLPLKMPPRPDLFRDRRRTVAQRRAGRSHAHAFGPAEQSGSIRTEHHARAQCRFGLGVG